MALNRANESGVKRSLQSALRGRTFAEQQFLTTGFVNVLDVDPTIEVDIPYATRGNFTGEILYPANVAFLRIGVAVRLARANAILKAHGFKLKVLDAYRPFHVQEKMWQVFPDAKYVMQPVREGGSLIAGSKHSRGAAVDVTLVTLRGDVVEMPTPFDDFTEKAHRNSLLWTREALKNYFLMDEAMKVAGFVGWPYEWWHYDSMDWESYALSDLPILTKGAIHGH